MASTSGRRGSSSEVSTFLYVPSESGRIRRFHVRRVWLRRLAGALVLASIGIGLLAIDYVRARRQLPELERLRAETAEQSEQIQSYSVRLEKISTHLVRISRLDRKLRVITDLDPADPLPLPGIGGIEGDLLEMHDLTGLTRDRRHERLTDGLRRLDEASAVQAESLAALISHLEDQTARLSATPSIPPTKGWITSTFGPRASPFTGNREFHRGVDIAGRTGTPVLAPADGQVIFAGRRRALGLAITIRHGYDIETLYGHLSEIMAKRGDKVRRGQQIGVMGNTGRSTGPHLHYQVQVADRAVNPQNYILD